MPDVDHGRDVHHRWDVENRCNKTMCISLKLLVFILFLYYKLYRLTFRFCLLYVIVLSYKYLLVSFSQRTHFFILRRLREQTPLPFQYYLVGRRYLFRGDNNFWRHSMFSCCAGCVQLCTFTNWPYEQLLCISYSAWYKNASFQRRPRLF